VKFICKCKFNKYGFKWCGTRWTIFLPCWKKKKKKKTFNMSSLCSSRKEAIVWPISIFYPRSYEVGFMFYLLGYCHLCGSNPTLGEGCHCQESAAGVAPTMCTHPRCQKLAATFVEEELELVAPFLPINRQKESRANWVKRERARQ
jgi:hypothetical protein